MGFLSDLGKYLGHAAVDTFGNMVPFKKGGRVKKQKKKAGKKKAGKKRK